MTVPAWNDPQNKEAEKKLRQLQVRDQDPRLPPVLRLLSVGLDRLEPDSDPMNVEYLRSLLSDLNRKALESPQGAKRAVAWLGNLPNLASLSPVEAAEQLAEDFHETIMLQSSNYPPPTTNQFRLP
jgi:hypothetical protein